MSIQSLWAKVPSKWQYELRSMFHTAIGAMIAEIAVIQPLLPHDGLSLTKEAAIAIATALLRSGVKAAWIVLFSDLSKWNEQAS